LIKLYNIGVARQLSPRQFKAGIGRVKSEFDNYQQQDAQEFMAFLLDGLHVATSRNFVYGVNYKALSLFRFDGF
jgi:ubiquitin C-terminal hydrolase